MTSATTKERVLVTGASSGIGLELAKCFAAGGYDLVLVARNESRLQELAKTLETEQGVEVHVIPCDLSKPDAPQQLFSQVEALNLSVDILVNNAGFGFHGKMDKLDPKAQLDCIQLNVLALTDLMLLLLPQMLERGRGGILNVASTASFQPVPRMGIYGATKAYVLSMTESLAEELRGSGVKVSCLCPGPTESEFGDKAGMNDALMFNLGLSTSAYVAKKGYRGLRRGKVVVVPGIGNKITIFFVRLLPRWVVRRIANFLQSVQVR